MKTPILFILAMTAAFLVTLNSCTKTVTQTKDIDSTVRDTIRDTARDTVGPAALRFLSLFPDSVASSLNFSTTPDGTNYAFSAKNAITNTYLPVSPYTQFTYYLYITNPTGQTTYFDSIPLPALGAGSIITYAIFDYGGHALAVRANDSAKTTPPPAGYSYFRFANGVPDYPNPPAVYVDLDDADTSIFRSSGADRPYGWTEISPYVLIPSGHHLVYVRDPTSGNALNSLDYSFQSGSYYTAHITGSYTAQNNRFRIDGE